MRLDRVVIKNFRSIHQETVVFHPRCRVLVGINEAGKSNILRALSMLKPENVPTAEDVREALPGEKPIDQAYVRFIFLLDQDDIALIASNVRRRLLTAHPAPTLVLYKNKELNLEEYCRLRAEGILVVDVKGQSKHFSCWSMQAVVSLKQRWKRPLSKTPSEISYALPNGDTVNLKDYLLIDCDSLSELPVNDLEKASVEGIDSAVTNEIIKLTKENLPKCIYWTYSDANLLPAQVIIAAFSANPDSCVPLRNMFELAGIEEINKELSEAQAKSQQSLRNLLNRVAEKTNRHIRRIWKECKGVEI